ncbi:MAG: hypothetical protein NC092_01750 [Butyrivibrio sp.]|nr:hypothetical protein [Muribaculum sp.]MCM1551399.1 hypothetical protein [Butyrivibrio sp.]
MEVNVNGEKHCKFNEWDKAGFVIPNEYILGDDSELADALKVFYDAGGYDFFNVVEPEYYADNWLEFIGNLYAEIDEGKYIIGNKSYQIPLSEAQKRELSDRGVPSVFVSDVR